LKRKRNLKINKESLPVNKAKAASRTQNNAKIRKEKNVKPEPAETFKAKLESKEAS
jgi:hypothetical protein